MNEIFPNAIPTEITEQAPSADSKEIAAAKTSFSFRVRVPALDGLRGLAILAVFLYHYAGGKDNHPHSFLLQTMYAVTKFGWAGVDLFFVLSGFLITGILYDTRHDPHYYKNFYIRRSLRIFPLYYLFLAVMAMVGIYVGVHWSASQALFLLYLGYPSALIVPDLIPQTPYLRLTHLWSLSVEEQFYLLWPFLILTLSTSRRILQLCGVLFFVALAMRLLVWSTGWLHEGWAYTFLPFRMDSLALGGALAMLVRGPLREKVMKLAPAVFITGAAFLALVLFFAPTTDHDAPQIWTVGFTLNTLVSGALLLLALRPNGMVQRLFDFRPLRELGKYSYGMYIYHFPLAVLLDPIKPPLIQAMHSEVLAKIIFVIGSLLVNYVVAKASFEFFESPILNLKSRFSYA